MTEPAHSNYAQQDGAAGSQTGEPPGSAQPRHLSVAPDPLPDEAEVLAAPENTELPRPNETAAPEDTAEDSDQPSAGEESLDFGERLRSWSAQLVMSPELVTKQRPSLKQVYHYARFSPHIPSGGLARALMLAHVWGIALPTVTACYGLAWAVERPARFYPAVALAALIAISMSQWTPTRWLLTVLLTPLHFAGVATDALTEW